MGNHTNSNNCYKEKISELVDICTNEYYMSALKIPGKSRKAHRQRAKRGYQRIKSCVQDLITLRENVRCAECQQEIYNQLIQIKSSIREIKWTWFFI